MDAEAQEKIRLGHGHLISSKPSAQISVKGKFSVEDSGPPSPTSGPVTNFGEVAPGIYRSSFPYPDNMDHLRSLGLKTILTLVDTAPSAEYVDFIKQTGVRQILIKVPAHKDPSIVIPIETITKVLRLMTDPSNHPLLIHCNKGKHRTGCMVACYRRLHNWTLPRVIEEYRSYAGMKFRPLDETFINTFNVQSARDIVAGVDIPYAPLETKQMLPTPPASDGNVEDDK